MTIELNMRLDSKKGVNGYEHFTLRQQTAIEFLGKYGEVALGRTQQPSNRTQARWVVTSSDGQGLSRDPKPDGLDRVRQHVDR